MKGIIYPYRIRLRYDGGIETLPLILSRIKYERGEPLTVLCLLDSGAQVSLLSKADADELNIVLADGEKMVVGGVGGEEIIGYRHNITIDIGGVSFSAPAVFAIRDDVPRVLGRDGVFNNFFIIFDEKRRRAALLKYQAAAITVMEKEIFSRLPIEPL
ncbi:MAG: hypothetical protein A3D41_03300 [Candidatus Sungbacteria bacterium RIFCSPHIGHO2_02_FULL_41_12b]|nr:MAG: hypothetical protein A3D41_03300 [Candidatus Sungbacteria bacterium RIFCSPHIGHO2_02_FULL_41_12b]